MFCLWLKLLYLGLIASLYLSPLCVGQDVVVCPVKCSCALVKISSFDRIRVKCGGDVRINTIGELNLNSYANLTDILSLDLSGNGITRVVTKSFPIHELQKLDLNKNEIELIEEGAFDGLAGLKRLDLSYNKIRVITRGMFDGLISLEKLKISQNLITHVKEGTFDSLLLLKTLDISNNPLVCDCDLWWLGGWNASGQVKLNPMPKCARPKELRNQPLRKLRPPLSCPWLSDNQPAPLELSPDQDQVVFEGDSLQLDCRVSAVGLFQPDSQLTWYWAGLHPHTVFSPSQVDTKTTNNNGLLESTLVISELELNHTGEWNCELISSAGNHSSTLSVIVLSDSTKYCMPAVTVDNKGSYSWPKTVAGHVVELPCQAEIGLGYARHNCTLDGRWSSLNTSVCPYVSETTRILQQYARMNLTAIRGNIVENAERLHNYTLENKVNLVDPMDIVFLTQTIENFVQFVSKEKRLGVLILDLISNSMDLSKELLSHAQDIDSSCAKLLLTVETVTQFIPSLESHKANMAVEEFPVSRESFVGMTCTWLRGLSGKPSDRLFQCSVGNKSGLNNVPQDKVLEASVEIPASVVHQVQAGQFYQLLVAMYDNDKLFPSHANTTTAVASSIVATKLVGVKENSVGGGSVVVTLGGVVGGGGRVRPAWWDPVARRWSTQACQPSHIVHDLLVLHCNRLGYYTLLRDTHQSNLHHRREQAKSRYASPFVYAGTFIGCTCMLVASFTYAVCHSSIMITSKMKHSLANNWIAVSSLCIIFSLGMYQTEDVYVCQSIGLLIHYFTLCSLFWMAISINGLHRGVRRREAVVGGSVSEAEPVGQPTLGQYLVGWGVASLLVGLSGAVNPSGYAAPTYCCLGPGPGFTPLLVPIFALFVFIVTRSLMVRSAAGEKDSNGQLSEGTQATDLELLEGGASAERCTSSGTERCLGPGCTEMTERASVRSVATPSSHLEDPEHSPCVHLKALIIVISTFSLIWTTAALSVLKPIGVPYEETIFSVIYCVLVILLGIFIIYFYCFSRSDVRTVWFTLKPLVRTRNIRDSRCAPPSSPRNSLTNSIGLKSITSRPEPQGETLKTNLIDLHRRQYSANRVVTEDSFYNPHQNVVARKFFKKQRRLRGVGRRAGDGGGSDSASDLFRVNRCAKRPLERLVIGAEASDSGRYASVVSECCSCHVSEAHSDCRDIMSDRSSRSSHVYATVSPPSHTCCSPRHRLALDPAREQARIKLSPSRHSHEHDKRETPV